MSLADKHFAVLVEDQYEDQELWYPTLRLREAGATVTMVGPEQGKTYLSIHDYPIESDKAARDMTENLDGLIIPGGYAPDRMRRHEAMVALVRRVSESGKIVAAICHAGWMLCSAGIVEGKRVTSFFAIKDDMVNAGANWVDQKVVQDGGLITSRTPNDLPDFMRTIIAVCQQERDVGSATERARHAG